MDINQIAQEINIAIQSENLYHINLLSTKLGRLPKSDFISLSIVGPNIIDCSTMLVVKYSYEDYLNKIAPVLGKMTRDKIYTLNKNSDIFLDAIAAAASCNNSSAFDAIITIVADKNKKDLLKKENIYCKHLE